MKALTKGFHLVPILCGAKWCEESYWVFLASDFTKSILGTWKSSYFAKIVLIDIWRHIFCIFAISFCNCGQNQGIFWTKMHNACSNKWIKVKTAQNIEEGQKVCSIARKENLKYFIALLDLFANTFIVIFVNIILLVLKAFSCLNPIMMIIFWEKTKKSLISYLLERLHTWNIRFT